MSAKWAIKLACGHWLPGQSAAARDRVLDSGRAECRICGPTEPTDGIRYGGLTSSQTKRKLERSRDAAQAWDAHRLAHPYRRMPDGLVVTPAPPTAFRWWCSECDGSDPPAWRKGTAVNVEQVESEWADHKATPGHLQRFGFVAPMTDERMALAAERVNLTRKPPPPRRVSAEANGPDR